MKTALIATAALIATLSMGNAQAGQEPFVERMEQRISNQSERIDKGLISGELTLKEASKLRRKNLRLHAMMWHFEEDGHFSKRERKQMRKALKKSSKTIARLMNNDRVQRDRYAENKQPRHSDYGHYRKSSIWF